MLWLTHAGWCLCSLPTYGGIRIQYFNLAILSWTENVVNVNEFWPYLKQLLLSFSQPNAPFTKWLQAWIHSNCNERCSSEPENLSALLFRLGRPFKVSHVRRYGWQASSDTPLAGEERKLVGKNALGKCFSSFSVLMSINKSPKKRPITNFITGLVLWVMNKPFLSWGCVYQIS